VRVLNEVKPAVKGKAKGGKKWEQYLVWLLDYL
jgi:hypothetical protein